MHTNEQNTHSLDLLTNEFLDRVLNIAPKVLGKEANELTKDDVRDFMWDLLIAILFMRNVPDVLELFAKILRVADPRLGDPERQRNVIEARRIFKNMYKKTLAPDLSMKGRTPKHYARDKEICRLRLTGLSFGHIGKKLGISDKVAQSAYKRQVQQSAPNQQILSRLNAILKELEACAASEEELPAEALPANSTK